ncbi:hypothetical protein RZO55_14615 [Clostridium boliviensis]|uniref:Uncharacterized protein n=1 Tax=Clostridium boliviensis TaxID=318465 RepID=A0ABU4GPH5_9CLOT|nr:hypothetical protein [Clostridium boliviensis]MDW2798808.1 hypothetical protein [Clostridium boliviensis]
MNRKIKIENYIDLNGDIVLLDLLPQERKKRAGERIRDQMMEHAGFIIREEKPVI